MDQRSHLDGIESLEKRQERRVFDQTMHVKVSIIAKVTDKEIVLPVLNYHYRGACIYLPETIEGTVFTSDEKIPPIEIVIGNSRLPRTTKYRVCWEDLSCSRTLGIEFLDRSSSGSIERSQRISSHEMFKPTVSISDPLEPTRTMLFTVENISADGLLLKTSLSNKHLLPGMELRKGSVEFPGGRSVCVDLSIANARKSLDNKTFYVGVRFIQPPEALQSEMMRYLAICRPSEDQSDILNDRFGKKLPKKIKDGLSFIQVKTQDRYEEVLKLRYEAYLKHNKVKPGSHYKDQGEGLEQEGLIIAGILGGKIVATAELRFGKDTLPFRSLKIFGSKILTHLDVPHTMEINKLAIHPKWQGSDIVLGLMQKMTAMVLAQGGLDILLAATDELKNFYNKVGARVLGVSADHPSIQGKKLNAMLINREIFYGSNRFTALGFETIYMSIYNHMVELGVLPPLKQTIFWNCRKQLEKTALWMKRLLGSGKGKTRDLSRDTKRDIPLETDGRWTKQHFLSSVVYPYILEADTMIGRDKVDSILRQLRISRSYLTSQGVWVSVNFLDAFCDEFMKFGDLKVLSQRAGIRGLQADVAGVNYYLLKFLTTPEFGFRSFAKTASRFNRTRTYRISSLTKNSVIVHLGYVAQELLPKHKESCLNWRSSLDYSLELLTGVQGQITKISCCYEGHDECSYLLKWSGSLGFFKRYSFYFYACLSAIILFLALRSFLSLEASVISLSSVVLLFSNIVLKKKAQVAAEDHKQALEQFERYQIDADSRYAQLQSAQEALSLRYKEAEILANSAKMIQKQPHSDLLLTACLNDLHDSFSFKRTCVMLADSTGKSLKMASYSGMGDETKIVKNFTVDISTKRDKGEFISSVYHYGHNVLITHAQEHRFQFNEASQEIINKLGIESFAVVPIPREKSEDISDSNCWGVLIAERSLGNHPMNQHDLSILNRLADHLGLALDKQAKLDREGMMRKVFQKYLSSAIVDRSIKSGKMPELGGEKRKITCMFIDLRDFTQLSAQKSPEESVKYLNSFFALSCEVLARHGGSVDKFIGDGIFVTWGALNQTNSSEIQAYRAAVELIQLISNRNQERRDNSVPPMKIGVGINTGEALVGNVGSADRMEFTCIGKTVNLASRVQELCKVYETSITITDTTFREIKQRLTQDMLRDWSEIHDVAIRGLEGTQSVFLYKPKSSGDFYYGQEILHSA